MATKKITRRKSSATGPKMDPASKNAKDKIKDIHLNDMADREYYQYGVAVIEDRAIFGSLDGLKPVLRRVLWAVHKLGLHSKSKPDKSAKAVGETLGNYHPHGDTACYDAIVNAASNVPIPMIYGEGNWGTMTENAAAMRYCFTADTRVMTDEGLVTFESLARTRGLPLKRAQELGLWEATEIKVASLKEPRRPSHLVNSGKHQVVEVRTRNGYNVKCTPNEPFLTLTPKGYKWKNAEDLSPTDWLCMKRDHGLTKFNVSNSLTVEAAVFLGYMVGDGYVNDGQNHIGFNQVDTQVFEDFVTCAKIVFPKQEHHVSQQVARSYGKQPYQQWTLNSVAVRKELSGKYGLHSGDSYDRRVPERVFQSTPEVVGAFLSALYEADGSVFTPSRGSSSIYLHSVSRDLLEDVSLLLRNYFGIFPSAPAPEKEGSAGLRMMIYGSENIRRFVDNIGFRSIRKQQSIVMSVNGRSNTDCIPYADLLKFSSNNAYSKTQRSTFRAKYEAGEIQSRAAKEIYERDYYYEQVVSVEEVGEEFVFDFCVPGTQAFVANGFIVHNTNMRLSKYADAIFFDDFYLPTMSYVPNYDGSRKEPLILPALLPNAVLNGNFGIAPGVNTRSPSFSLESVVEVLKEALTTNKGVVTPAMCMKLVFTTPFGGKAYRTKSNRPDFVQFFKTGKGRVTFKSTHTEPNAANEIRFDAFAPISEIEKVIGKVVSIKGVAGIRDDSDKHDKYQAAYVVSFVRTCKGQELSRAIAAVEAAFSSTYTFNVQVTDRFLKEDGTDGAKLRPTTTADMLTFWLEYRKNLEVHACKYWIGVRSKDIAYLKLMRLAISKLDFIFACVKNKKLDDAALVKAISKGLKITDEETNLILARNLRQLRHLEDQKLVQQIKDIEAERATYEGRMKKPMTYIGKHLDVLLTDVSKAIAAERSAKMGKNK